MEPNRLLFELKMSDALTADLDRDPATVLGRYQLLREEIDAVNAQDPRRIRARADGRAGALRAPCNYPHGSVHLLVTEIGKQGPHRGNCEWPRPPLRVRPICPNGVTAQRRACSWSTLFFVGAIRIDGSTMPRRATYRAADEGVLLLAGARAGLESTPKSRQERRMQRFQPKSQCSWRPHSIKTQFDLAIGTRLRQQPRGPRRASWPVLLWPSVSARSPRR